MFPLTTNDRDRLNKFILYVEKKKSKRGVLPILIFFETMTRVPVLRGVSVVALGVLIFVMRCVRAPQMIINTMLCKFSLVASLHHACSLVSTPEAAELFARELLIKFGLLLWCDVLPRSEACALSIDQLMHLFKTRVKAAMGPESTDKVERIGHDAFELRVERCMLIEITTRLGIAHLAPYLCMTDDLYLSQLCPHITFTHASLLTRGEPRCVFRFQQVTRSH